MTRDASLRQRSGYSFANHGSFTSNYANGKHYILNNQADIWSPNFQDGTTTIRIFPTVQPTGAPAGQPQLQWTPYRYSAEPNDFGDWLRRYPAVRSCGEPGVSFIMADPSQGDVIDEQMLPAWVLYNAIHRAIKNGTEEKGWAALTKGGAGRGALLARPSSVYLVQCALMQHGRNVYAPPRGFGEEDRLVVMELSQSAGEAMTTEMNKIREGSQAVDFDWQNMFVYGDPISLENGAYVNFYSLERGDPRSAQTTAAGGWNAPSQQAGGRRGNDPKGFGCFLEPTFRNLPARLIEYQQRVAAKVKPWDQILRFPTVEEQAHLLADKFRPDVILYAFQDHKDWIPETIRNRAVARTVVDAPAGGWTQYQNGGPGAAPPAGQFDGGGTAPAAAAYTGFGDAGQQPQQQTYGAPPTQQTVAPGQAPQQFAAPQQPYVAPQNVAPQNVAPQQYVAPQQAAPQQPYVAPQQAAPQQQYVAPQQAAPQQPYVAPQQAAPQNVVPQQQYVAPQQAAPQQSYVAPQQNAPPAGQHQPAPQQHVAPHQAAPAATGWDAPSQPAQQQQAAPQQQYAAPQQQAAPQGDGAAWGPVAAPVTAPANGGYVQPAANGGQPAPVGSSRAAAALAAAAGAMGAPPSGT